MHFPRLPFRLSGGRHYRPHSGVIIDVNARAAAIAGYPREEIIGRSALELGLWAQPAARAEFNANVETGALRESYVELRRRDGSLRQLLVRATPLSLDNPARRALAWTMSDVTELVHAEKERAGALERFNLFAQALPLAFLQIDAEDNVVEVNPALERLFGFSRGDMLGHPPAATILPPASWVEGEVVIAHLRQGLSITGMIENTTKDGQPLLIEWSSTPLLRDGRYLGAWCLGSDVTARLAAEREVHRLNQDLEQRVGERTAQLEASNRELEFFTYSVSHDLRAPVRHLDGFARLAREHGRKADPEMVRYLDIIAGAATKLGLLIDDLLAFSHSSRAEMRREPIELEALVREARLECMRDVTDRRIEWDLGRLPAVAGDPRLLKQVFLNVFENALKFTATRDLATIRMTSTVANGEIVIRVQDNGVGFDMRFASKIFGVFQRLHSDAEFPGTGVGLATVARIIERHGGRVWAESRFGHGASFYLALPTAVVDEKANPL